MGEKSRRRKRRRWRQLQISSSPERGRAKLQGRQHENVEEGCNTMRGEGKQEMIPKPEQMGQEITAKGCRHTERAGQTDRAGGKLSQLPKPPKLGAHIILQAGEKCCIISIPTGTGQLMLLTWGA